MCRVINVIIIAMLSSAYVFLGLKMLDTVEDDVKAAGENARVMRFPSHGVCFTRPSDAIGKEKAYRRKDERCKVFMCH